MAQRFATFVFILLPTMALGQAADDFLPAKDSGKVAASGSVAPAIPKYETDDAAAAAAVSRAQDECFPYFARSGPGWTCQGTATYQVYKNPTATRVARKNAYFQAYNTAKSMLLQTMKGVKARGADVFKTAAEGFTTTEEDSTNISITTSQANETSVQGLLRGYVVKKLHDDGKGTVQVVIVITPRTITAVTRPSVNMVQGQSLKAALQGLLDEFASGLIPPVGGKFIRSADGKQTAVLGFGSTVVRTSRNRMAQKQLEQMAHRTAKVRAQTSLLRILKGDQNFWKSREMESTEQESKEFVRLAADDPLRSEYPEGVKLLEQSQETFMNSWRSESVFKAVVDGKLPPGVVVRSFASKVDPMLVYAVALYNPALTSQTQKLDRAMVEGVPVESVGASRSPGDDKLKPGVVYGDAKVAPGPSGEVTSDDDL